MGYTTRATLDAILKDLYLGPIREQLNSDTLLMHRLQKRDDLMVDGKRWVMPLHVGRNVGVQAVGEAVDASTGNMPDPGTQQYTQATGKVRYNYGVIQISGPSMASTRTERGAFLTALDSEIKGLVRDFKTDLNRQLWGDGSGRLAAYVSGTGTATLRVKHPFDFNDQARLLKGFNIGDRLALEDVSAAAGANVVALNGANFYAVTGLSLANKTLTFAGNAGGLAAGDSLIKGNSTNQAVGQSYSNYRGATSGTAWNEAMEMMGLCGIMSGANGWAGRVGDAAYTYIPLSTNGSGQHYVGSNAGTAVFQALHDVDSPYWAANMFFNGGNLRQLSTDLIQQAVDISEELGQGAPTIGLTTYAVRRRMIDMLIADRRYVNTMDLDGGFRALDYDGIPFVPEKDCPEGAIFLPNEDELAIARMSDFYWLDKDGAILSRVIGSNGSAKDAWSAIMAYYADLIASRRNCHAVIGDLAVN